MLGTLVNMGAILLGGAIGLLLKGRLSRTIADSVMNGLALCTLFIGISGALKGDNVLLAVISIALGTLVGEGLRIEDRLNSLGALLERRIQPNGGEQGGIARGFVAASLLFCVGAMAILGSLESGLRGDHSILFTKSLLDGVAAIIFASAMGTGVLLSALAVLAYQGTITLISSVVAPLLNDAVINNMSMVGSLIIVGLGFNMLGMTKIRVSNMLPAILVPLLYSLLQGFLPL